MKGRKVKWNVNHFVYSSSRKDRPPHVHTGCLRFVWASDGCETLLNSRHFVNFAAIVLQVGLRELLPHRRVHGRTYWDWRLACVHVRVCTCVFTQECGFVLYPPSVAFLWGIFPDSFSYCDEKKPNTSCFPDYIEKRRFVCPSRLCGTIIKSGFGCVI